MTEIDWQPFPSGGQLQKGLNQRLSDLKSLMDTERTTIYYYVVATVHNRNGYFYQTGCGPNFQGDIVTLCTCKHYMRTFFGTSDWVGKWIAGFSSISAGEGNNALVFLMKVATAFKSQKDLWESDLIPSENKLAKSARLNELGDLYEPISDSCNPYDYQWYVPPHKNHAHLVNDEWHKDIDYHKGCSNRKPALLVGDPVNSYLWDKPMILYASKIHRGQKKSSIDIFLAYLQEK
jgi:hypothetical protein